MGRTCNQGFSYLGKVRKSRRRAVRRESSFGNSEYGLKKTATFGTLSLWGLACSTRLIQRIPVQAMTGIGSPTEAKISYTIPPSNNLKALIKEIYRTAQAGNRNTAFTLSKVETLHDCLFCYSHPSTQERSYLSQSRRALTKHNSALTHPRDSVGCSTFSWTSLLATVCFLLRKLIH